MRYLADYSLAHDWDYERASLRADAIESRTAELIGELKNDAEAMAEAWDDHTCHELTGKEVAVYLRNNDAAGLFRAVQTLVSLGIVPIAEARAEQEIGE